MPTNVPPQYREAEDRFRQARTVQAKVAALQEMLAIMPKHKGTDHLKAQLRSRLSKLMGELEGASSKGPGSGRTEPFSMPKEGGGRATLIGPDQHRQVPHAQPLHRRTEQGRRVRAQHAGAGARDAELRGRAHPVRGYTPDLQSIDPGPAVRPAPKHRRLRSRGRSVDGRRLPGRRRVHRTG